VQDAACPTHKQVDHYFKVEGADRPAADEYSSFVAHIKGLSKELHPGLHPGIHPGIHPGAWFNLGPSKIHAAGQAPLITHAAAAKLEKLTKQYGECCILCVTDPRFYLPGKIINTQPARGIDWIIQYVLPFMYKGKWYTLMPYNTQEIPLMLRANANTGHTEGTAIRQKELHGFLESTLVTNDGIGIPGLSVTHTHLQEAHARLQLVAGYELVVHGYNSPGSFEAVARRGDILVAVTRTTPHSNKRKRNGRRTRTSKGGHRVLATNNSNASRDWMGTSGTFLRQTNKSIKKIQARFPALDPHNNWAVYTNARHAINGHCTADLLLPFDQWRPSIRQSFAAQTPTKVTEALQAYTNSAVAPAAYAPDQTNVLYWFGVLVCTQPNHFGSTALFTRTGAVLHFYSLDPVCPLPAHTLARHWVTQAAVRIDPRHGRSTKFETLVHAALTRASFAAPRFALHLVPKPPSHGTAALCRACSQPVTGERVAYTVRTPWYGQVWRHAACLQVQRELPNI